MLSGPGFHTHLQLKNAHVARPRRQMEDLDLLFKKLTSFPERRDRSTSQGLSTPAAPWQCLVLSSHQRGRRSGMQCWLCFVLKCWEPNSGPFMCSKALKERLIQTHEFGRCLPEVSLPPLVSSSMKHVGSDDTNLQVVNPSIT